MQPFHNCLWNYFIDETLATTQKSFKNNPGCNPVGYFKTPKNQTCLAVQRDKNGFIKFGQVYHRACKENQIEHWAWINGAHICNTQQKNCLTVSSHSNWRNIKNLYNNPKDLFLELTEYNPKLEYQQWKLDKRTGVISIFVNSMNICLSNNLQSTFRFPNSVETPVYLDYNIIGGFSCISWTFVPIPEAGNGQVCY